MTNKNIVLSVGSVVAIAVVGYFFLFSPLAKKEMAQDIDPTPKNVTLSGTYECLPHLDTTGPQTLECAFGFKADDGAHYAINFGASADSFQQFQSGARITAEGFVVPKVALSTDQWAKYNMEGVFTVTRVISPTPVQGKINIDVVCRGALAYMSFPDGASADLFVAECKEGKHPEVIEQYKLQMGLGDGATI